ncbi:MAG: S8 family serine peptidase [Bacteroidota bacterium]|nr:S8 family serine peptidase [Bacteroidota bacterium]
MKNIYIFTILLLISTGTFSQQVITSPLHDAINKNPNNKIEVMVYFNDEVDLPQFDRAMRTKRATKSQRIRLLRHKLESVASHSQRLFLERLHNIMTNQQNLTIKRGFWILNAMCIEATPELINAMAADETVKRIDINSPRYRNEEPVAVEPASIRTVGGTEPGLEAVNAPALWAMGYTGRNTLFLSIDTGVFTDHPAIADSYAGNHFPLEYVWYGMRNPFPFDHSSSTHGTHTTGTVLGLEHETNDTIGMAWASYWMASDPVASSNSEILDPAVLLEVFEWVLDPDGNPSTTHDVPDVINNSWGYDYDMALEMNACEMEEAHILEVVEAAGICSPFSAGNDGPDAATIGFPAMMTFNELNAMSVGAVNGNTSGYPIANFSSHGPTTCNDSSGPINIKPEVSAPGVSVRSASGHDGYANLSGTSMACPHVSGALLLLKEAFPYLGAYELKDALYKTASDLGDPGEDNTYGNGIIDVHAAYQYLAVTNDPVPPVTDSFDLAITVDNPTALYYCPEQANWTPVCTFSNKGQESVSEIHYHYSLNYGDTISNTWYGNLTSGSHIDVTMGEIELAPGFNELYIWAENPDAGREYNRFNNAGVAHINLMSQENYPWSEHFDNVEAGFMNTPWVVENEDNQRTWEISDVHGGDSRALMMNCLNYFDEGQQDHVYSPVISLPQTDSITLSFNLAYQNRMEDLFADSIKVYAATGCGSEFTHLLYSDGDETMATVEGNSSNNHFVPDTLTDWDTIHVDISNFAGEDIMLKFTAINDNGSSMYVDNVAVSGSQSSIEKSNKNDAFSIFPNPAHHDVKVVFKHATKYDGIFTVYNLQGQALRNFSINKGTKTQSLNLTGLPAGVYILRYAGSDITGVKRFVVQ